MKNRILLSLLALTFFLTLPFQCGRAEPVIDDPNVDTSSVNDVSDHQPPLEELPLVEAADTSSVSSQPADQSNRSQQNEDGWIFLRTAVEYQVFNKTYEGRPVNVFVARMHRNNPNITIETGIADGKLANGVDTITGMAANNDQAVSYWNSTWGNRNDVVIAVNGYFFNTDPSDSNYGMPISGLINSGWYSHRFIDVRGDAGFAWTLDSQAFIGSCVDHVADKNDVFFVETGDYSPNIQGVNVPHNGEDLILYTPQYDATTNTVSTEGDPVLEIVVELTRPSVLISDPSYVKGHIRQIRDEKGSTPIRFDYVVLSFWGDVREAVLGRIDSGAIAVGDEVQITQEVRDCPSTDTKRPWTKTYASLGGDYHFLTDGEPRTSFSNPDAYVPNSRTAVAFNADFVYLIVVDAFDPGVSEGIKVAELLDFVQKDLGATDGVTLDSGTSSTMVAHYASDDVFQVINNTYCNFTRDCGMVAEADAYSAPGALLPPEQTYKTQWDDTSGTLEPLVGSSLMIVSVQPKELSTTFTEEQTVYAITDSKVRLGPGVNYASLGDVSAGSEGFIVPHSNGMNGVLAKGSYWWLVDFGDLAGWVPEETLQGGQLPPDFEPTDFVYLPGINRENLVR